MSAKNIPISNLNRTQALTVNELILECPGISQFNASHAQFHFKEIIF